MKVGDLVKRIDNWLKFNPWMSDTEQLGIIIKLPQGSIYGVSITVLWATLGITKEHPDDIDLID